MTKDNSAQLAHNVVNWALEKKAEDVLRMDLTGLLDVTDYFVVATGNSEIQVQTIADSIVDGAAAAQSKPLSVEGRDGGQWVLIDFVDVVVHVMLPEVRQKYKLERLWGDATMTWFDERGQPLDGGESASNSEVAG